VRTSFTKKVRQHKPTEAAPTQHAAADQQANKATLVAAALILFLADVVVIVLLLVPFAQEMGKEQATQAPAAYHTTTDQKTGDPSFV
jgi:hypothetical protein